MTIRVAGRTVVDGNRNVIVGDVLVTPSSPTAGTIVFDANDRVVQGWNGSTWVPLTVSGNGEALAWGFNNSGQLGNGSAFANQSSPVSVASSISDWVQVDGGGSHTVALRGNGTVWSWGQNSSGQLGDGTMTNKSSPVAVVGGFTDWVDVGAGEIHTVALRSNGTLWAWGFNNNGQLGTNNTSSFSSPVSIGGFTDWVEVSAGTYHNVAIRSNGQAWSWGSNSSGQLGDGTATTKSSPVSIVGDITNWVQINAGRSHTVGVRSDGTAWAWGSNNRGELGTNNTSNFSSPVPVVGGFTDWVQLAASLNSPGHTVGVRANGQLWAWGCNSNSIFGSGQLGDGTTSDRSSPVSVLGGFTDWVQVSAGKEFTVALRSNGTAWAWGDNSWDSGKLGDGTTTNRSSPVSVVGGITNWVQVDAGSSHTAAIRFS